MLLCHSGRMQAKMEAITGQFCEEQEQNCPEWVCWWQCQGLEICTNYVLLAATYAAQKVSSCFSK